MRAAVIGLGRIGFEFGLEKGRQQPASHVACYQQIPAATEIAVCDIDNNKLQAAFTSKPDLFRYYPDMLEKFKPEVVSVCTPTPTHKEIVCNVTECKSVKAVFLEKPIAQSLQEADQMIAACKKNNVKLTVDFMRRWDSMYLQLFRFKPETLIGIHPGPLLRTGIHMLDLFNMIMNQIPRAVQAFGSLRSNYLNTEDWNINGCVHYDAGEAVLYSGPSIEKTVLFELELLGDSVMARMTGNGERLEIFRAIPSCRYSGLNEFVSSAVETRIGRFPQNPLLNAVQEVTDLEHKGRNSCSGEDARKALNVALALHYSATHLQKIVPLHEVPKDYTVRSY